MEGKANQGFLVIGDISGYTSYVAKTELEHSQAVLTELLALIMEKFKSVLTLVKLEGDAVFAHAPRENVMRGEAVLDVVEGTYYAFRQRVEHIRHLTTCNCNACRQIPSLDLKFIVHFGEYFVQNVLGVIDLVGSDVNLIHRLTKNSVTEATGWNAYAMFTEKSLNAIGVPLEGLFEQRESYAHLGDILTYNLDLHTRFNEMRMANPIQISREEADISIEMEIKAPPAVVWEWVTDPRRRNEYQDGVSWSGPVRPGGRNRIGAQNHCAHGKDELAIETVLDWRPFEYYTTAGDKNEKFSMDVSYIFVGEDEGKKTRLHMHMKLGGKMPAFILRWMGPMMMRKYRTHVLGKMERLIEEQMAGKAPPEENKIHFDFNQGGQE